MDALEKLDLLEEHADLVTQLQGGGIDALDKLDMLERLAEESGIKTSTKAELITFNRKRKGKKTSNKDWQSTTDEESRIAKLKDGRTHMPTSSSMWLIWSPGRLFLR